MHLLVNMPRFPENWSIGAWSGSAAVRTTYEEMMRDRAKADAIIVNTDVALIYKLAVASKLHRLRCPIFFVDSILRAPGPGLRERATHIAKRYLLGEIHHHVHYFKDLSGYARHFGITEKSSSYAAFRACAWPDGMEVAAQPDGDYLFCFGWSKRDYETFFRVVEETGLPAVIARPDLAQLRKHGGRFERRLDQLPPTVTLVDHDFSSASQRQLLLGARLVILPILPTALCSAGISTYLNAMRAGKCVIITSGPGVGDLLKDEACIVPNGDFPALVTATKRLWENDEERHRIGTSGYRYAAGLGGEQDLYLRVLENVVRVLNGEPLPKSNRCFTGGNAAPD